MRKLTIRPLRPGDSPNVLRLNQLAQPAVSQLDLVEYMRLLDMSDLHLAAVQSDGALVGYVLAFDQTHAYDGEEFCVFRKRLAEPFVYIDQIAIDPRLRGAGVGRTMYLELAQRAHAAGAVMLCCEVNTRPPNPDSLAFHQRMGFAMIADIQTLDGRTAALLLRTV